MVKEYLSKISIRLIMLNEFKLFFNSIYMKLNLFKIYLHR